MTRIDLDDLPPRVARLLGDLAAGEDLVLVRGGAVVSRLLIAAAESETSPAEAATETDMEEILEHFKTMIEEEF